VFTGSVFPHRFCAGHRFTLWKSDRHQRATPGRVRAMAGLQRMGPMGLGAGVLEERKATREHGRMALCRCSPGSVHPLSIPLGPRSTILIRSYSGAITFTYR
jgi:hypothetical protein